MTARLVLLLTALTVSACDPLGPVKVDAGLSDAGSPPSPNFPDAGAWAWGALAGLPAERWPQKVVSMQGTRDDLWVLLSTGDLLHSTGGPLALAIHFAAPKRDFVKVGDLFVVVDTDHLSWCRGADCTMEANFQRLAVNRGNYSGAMLCARDGHIAAIIGGPGSPIYDWNGSTFALLGDLGANVAFINQVSCWFDAQGRLFVPSVGGVLIVDQGQSHVEAVGPSDRNYVGGADVEGIPWLLGEYGAVYRRDGSTWVPIQTSEPSGTFASVASFTSGERYLFGRDPFQGRALAVRVDGAQPVPLTALPDLGSHPGLFRVLQTGPDEFFVAATSDRSLFVLRASR